MFLNAGLVIGGILCAAGLYYALYPGKSSGKQWRKTPAAENRLPSSLVSAYDRWDASRSRDDLTAFVTILKANWGILPKGIAGGAGGFFHKLTSGRVAAWNEGTGKSSQTHIATRFSGNLFYS